MHCWQCILSYVFRRQYQDDLISKPLIIVNYQFSIVNYNYICTEQNL